MRCNILSVAVIQRRDWPSFALNPSFRDLAPEPLLAKPTQDTLHSSGRRTHALH